MRPIKILVPLLVLAVLLCSCGQKAGEIKLNTGSVTLKTENATSKLAASVHDTNGKVIADLKQPVAWTTSDASVATVDSAGTVKAVGTGTALVTASLGGLNASAQVNVQIVGTVNVEPSSYNLKVGESRVFVAMVRDEKGNNMTVPITWKIGNANVASVNSKGNVKAIAGGKTVIKAVAGGKMGKASLTVIEFKKDKDSKVGGLKKNVPIKKAAGLKKKKK